MFLEYCCLSIKWHLLTYCMNPVVTAFSWKLVNRGLIFNNIQITYQTMNCKTTLPWFSFMFSVWRWKWRIKILCMFSVFDSFICNFWFFYYFPNKYFSSFCCIIYLHIPCLKFIILVFFYTIKIISLDWLWRTLHLFKPLFISGIATIKICI